MFQDDVILKYITCMDGEEIFYLRFIAYKYSVIMILF